MEKSQKEMGTQKEEQRPRGENSEVEGLRKRETWAGGRSEGQAGAEG